MRKVILFMMVSLDGYFEGPNHDISWHNVDKEFNKFAAENMKESEVLLFGRRTYEMMASFWPNHLVTSGDKDDATVTDRMNNLPKVVFSNTLKKLKPNKNWKNAALAGNNLTEEIMKLKNQSGKKISVLGSSNLCVSLLNMGLLDEIQIMINPVVLGAGTQLFNGIADRLEFRLLETRAFKSGNILLTYQVSKK